MAEEFILIIEDDPAMLRGLKDNFSFKGYITETAGDGESGLEKILNLEPDLVILDIMLPKMNGFEVCRRTRQAGISMPIIMLTARGQEEDIVRGLNLGADDYVTKPFSIKQLLARVNAFLRRYKRPENKIYEFGECKVNFISRKFYRNEKELKLTPKEFKLLEHFIRNPGRALTRNQIMNAVWGSNILVTARSVDRCVTTLRSKIESDPHHPRIIHTIREIGYRFEWGDEGFGD